MKGTGEPSVDATPTPDLGSPHLALVGMMGSGKTTVARLLGRQTGHRVVDLDAVLIEQERAPIPELFAAHGETWFRARESAVMEAALADDTPAVLSLGGGIVLRPENRVALRARCGVVWLRATPATVLSRVGNGADRPMLAGDPARRVAALIEERAPLYRDAAHLVVDVDELGAVQVADCVRAAIRAIRPDHWAV